MKSALEPPILKIGSNYYKNTQELILQAQKIKDHFFFELP